MRWNIYLVVTICALLLLARSPRAAGEAASPPAEAVPDEARAKMLAKENEWLRERVSQLENRVQELMNEIGKLEAGVARKAPDVPAEMKATLADAVKRLERFGGDYYLRADYKGAWPLLKSAVDLGSQDPEVMFRLAYCFSTIGALKEAAEYYQKASDGFEKNKETMYRLIDSLNNLAVTYARDKRHNEAAKALKKILETEPNHPAAWFNLAVLYQDHLKMPDEAVKAYRQHIVLGGDRSASAAKAIEALLKKMDEETQKKERPAEPAKEAN